MGLQLAYFDNVARRFVPAPAGVAGVTRSVITTQGVQVVTDPTSVPRENWHGNLQRYRYNYAADALATGWQLADLAFDVANNQFTVLAGALLPDAPVAQDSLLANFVGTIEDGSAGANVDRLDFVVPLPVYIGLASAAGNTIPMGAPGGEASYYYNGSIMNAGGAAISTLNFSGSVADVLTYDADGIDFDLSAVDAPLLRADVVVPNNGVFADLSNPTQAELDLVQIRNLQTSLSIYLGFTVV